MNNLYLKEKAKESKAKKVHATKTRSGYFKMLKREGMLPETTRESRSSKKKDQKNDANQEPLGIKKSVDDPFPSEEEQDEEVINEENKKAFERNSTKPSRSAKINPYKKALDIRKEKQAEQKRKRKEYQANLELKQAKYKENNERRAKASQVYAKKTRTGQPAMGDRITLLLNKIRSQSK